MRVYSRPSLTTAKLLLPPALFIELILANWAAEGPAAFSVATLLVLGPPLLVIVAAIMSSDAARPAPLILASILLLPTLWIGLLFFFGIFLIPGAIALLFTTIHAVRHAESQPSEVSPP